MGVIFAKFSFRHYNEYRYELKTWHRKLFHRVMNKRSPLYTDVSFAGRDFFRHFGCYLWVLCPLNELQEYELEGLASQMIQYLDGKSQKYYTTGRNNCTEENIVHFKFMFCQTAICFVCSWLSYNIMHNPPRSKMQLTLCISLHLWQTN
jgi:hypothetical protein